MSESFMCMSIRIALQSLRVSGPRRAMSVFSLLPPKRKSMFFFALDEMGVF